MKKKIIVFMIILMLFPYFVFAETKDESIENKDDNIIVNTNTEIVTLEGCIDGDTAKFKTSKDEIIKARFLAIDTPETVHPTKGEEPFGKNASQYTCTTLTNAKEIKIEYDDNSDKEDNYGRKLVWVFVDNVLLQNSLISQGYAKIAYLYGDYKYTSFLQDSEEIAKVNKVGIWSLENVVEEVEPEIIEKDEKNKNFVDKIIDDMLAMVYDLIDELIESLLKSIEDML